MLMYKRRFIHLPFILHDLQSFLFPYTYNHKKLHPNIYISLHLTTDYHANAISTLFEMFYGGSIGSDREKWRLINIELD